jgi:hypothetical protein
MRHEDRPKTIPDAVHAVQFPVYGLTDHPFDLSLLSHGMSSWSSRVHVISHLLWIIAIQQNARIFV